MRSYKLNFLHANYGRKILCYSNLFLYILMWPLSSFMNYLEYNTLLMSYVTTSMGEFLVAIRRIDPVIVLLVGWHPWVNLVILVMEDLVLFGIVNVYLCLSGLIKELLWIVTVVRSLNIRLFIEVTLWLCVIDCWNHLVYSYHS